MNSYTSLGQLVATSRDHINDLSPKYSHYVYMF